MQSLRYLLRKEFLQIFRDRFMVMQLMLMPIIQLLLLGNAATFEVKTARMYVDRCRQPVDARAADRHDPRDPGRLRARHRAHALRPGTAGDERRGWCRGGSDAIVRGADHRGVRERAGIRTDSHGDQGGSRGWCRRCWWCER